MNKPKVSILVPIFNSSNYLEECLDSLESQSLNEIEFILVNDGSTDNSLEIIKKYIKQDARFCVLDKKNTGYGDSLNQAMKKARGEYIGIVEPDDYCDKDMFGLLYDRAIEIDAEICRGNYYHFSKKGKRVNQFKFINIQKKLFDPVYDYEIFYEAPAIWASIYKKDLIVKNRIEFLPTSGASYQDAGFSFKTLACAERVAFINRPLYYYRNDNPNSSVKSSKKVMAVVEEYREIEKFIKNKDRILMKYCQTAKFGAYNWNLDRLDGRGRKKFIRVMKNEFLRQKKDGNICYRLFPRKYRILLRILLYCPVYFYIVGLNCRKMLKML